MNDKLIAEHPLPWRAFDQHNTHGTIMDSRGRIVMQIKAAPLGQNAVDLVEGIVHAANAQPVKISKMETIFNMSEAELKGHLDDVHRRLLELGGADLSTTEPPVSDEDLDKLTAPETADDRVKRANDEHAEKFEEYRQKTA